VSEIVVRFVLDAMADEYYFASRGSVVSSGRPRIVSLRKPMFGNTLRSKVLLIRTMRATFVLAGLATRCASSAAAQIAPAQLTTNLAKRPAGAPHFIIESPGGKHVDSWSWTLPDGTRTARETWNLRGQVWDETFGASGGTAGQDKHTGSIKVGETADLVLVESDPQTTSATLSTPAP
jgi:hypothetical protein